MAFVHRLVVVGFVIAALLGKFMTGGTPMGADVWIEFSLVLGGGFAFLVYLLTWMCRGSLRSSRATF